MIWWIANAGPAGVLLTLGTIRDHVATIARDMGKPPTFRCSVGWVRRAMHHHGICCRSALGEAADADHNAVKTCKEKLPQLLMRMSVTPRNVFNLDETALWLSVLPRKTYGTGRVARRKNAKERLTVAFLVNADGSHVFRPLVIFMAARPHDFRPDYDPEPLCYWWNNKKGWMTAPLFTHFIEQVSAAMFAEKCHIVILLDNASNHVLQSETATSEDIFGFRTPSISNVTLVYLLPNTTSFTQPLDQGMIATVKARYRAHWLKAFTAYWKEIGGTSTAMRRFRPTLRDVLEWLSDAWMSIGERTIQRCWWRTGCLPLSWQLDLAHVGEPGDEGEAEIELDEDIRDVGVLIDRLALGPSAMLAAEFVTVDNYEPTSAEPSKDPLATEPESDTARSSWEAPLDVMAVCEDARSACKMLIGYATFALYLTSVTRLS
ncbi:unnamed protein product [Closterium sp. Yama58-4]|nr:unnamed protein product [Closterium sp. Yama58-4]